MADQQLLEMPLRRAAAYEEDLGVQWICVMPLILAGFPQITPDAYWNLTVAEGLAFLDYLTPKKERRGRRTDA